MNPLYKPSTLLQNDGKGLNNMQGVAKGLGHRIAGMAFRLPMIFSIHFVVNMIILWAG